MVDSAPKFGWAGPDEAQRAWEQTAHNFVPFVVRGTTERKRTCVWDAFKEIGITYDWAEQRQEVGDCVGWGACNALMAVMAWEIARLGEFEKFHFIFVPYVYAVSRMAPECGNGRLGRSDGSTGSWAATGLRKYGALRADFDGVPNYSGSIASEWGSSNKWKQYQDEADDHILKSTARITSGDQLADAICNGYFCSIASDKGWSMQLRNRDGKSWFQGSDTWMHQQSFWGYDEVPEPCVYMKNQWGRNAHGEQLDGPGGGGWRTLEEVDRDIRRGSTECYAFSQFDGFPSEENKPRNYFA